MRAIAISLLMAACVPVQPVYLPDADRESIEAFLAAWSARGMPSLDRCFIREARVLHALTDAQFENECRQAVERNASCISQVNDQVGMVVHAIPFVVVRPGQPSRDSMGGPVLHELIHWASSCVLEQPGSGLNAQDPGHKDKRLWMAPNDTQAGRDDSVQGRAAAILIR